jgi:hypothetical protein
VQSNREEFNGRVFVLVLDDLQTDARRSLVLRAGARQFITMYIGANDLAAVVYTGGSTDKGQEFTSSRARLLASVDKFIGNKLPSELMSKLDDYYRAQQLGAAEGRQPGRAWLQGAQLAHYPQESRAMLCPACTTPKSRRLVWRRD